MDHLVGQGMQTKAEFDAHLNKAFDVELDGGKLSVVLSEVSGLRHGERDGGAFTLVFEAPEDVHLDQGTYKMHSEGTEVELFLVPIGPFGKGMGFEAVFT